MSERERRYYRELIDPPSPLFYPPYLRTPFEKSVDVARSFSHSTHCVTIKALTFAVTVYSHCSCFSSSASASSACEMCLYADGNTTARWFGRREVSEEKSYRLSGVHWPRRKNFFVNLIGLRVYRCAYLFEKRMNFIEYLLRDRCGGITLSAYMYRYSVKIGKAIQFSRLKVNLWFRFRKT